MSHRSERPRRALSARALSTPELLLIGAGGLAREALATIHAINLLEPTWRPLGFLDDNAAMHGERVAGAPVLGDPDDLADYPDAMVLLCTCRPDDYDSRRRLADRLGIEDERFATVVHPSVAVGAGSEIGAGSLLLAGVALTADVVIGRHVVVMSHVVLTHDVVVEDWATLAAGVRVGGSCRIARGAYVGMGACLREQITVGARAMVGMGSVVTGDVPQERMFYGVPARDMGTPPVPFSFTR